MTTRIINTKQKNSMVAQLVALGGTATKSDAGVVVTHPKAGEVFRAMKGARGTHLARWMDGLFDAVPAQ
ncbi:hypothetical protein vBRpoSV10_9 [Ruegeria phage vB_RpoS-V10]|nr:hypothetical protein DSS3P8_010 [Roseobacter phage DSS3P8]AWY09131.1 hypothetical protein vBRpoSV10_9 [Ruegeria phage vB_RpoS-V10]